MEDNEKRTDEEEITDIPEEETNGTDSELHRILYGGEYSEYQGDLGAEEEELPAHKMNLRTFSSPEKPVKEAKATKTENSKKLLIIIIASAVILAMIPLLILVISWSKTAEEPPPDLYYDEALSSSNRVMMFEKIPREQIQAIEVHNSYGDYTVYYNAEKGYFSFYGLEGVPYNEELFSQLVVSAGFPLISDRFLPDEERAPLEDYGLGENDEKAYYIITTRAKKETPSKSYKVYIGKPSLNENYYYCMVEGNDIVYILEQSIKTTLLADVKSLLTPILTYPIEDNSYLTNIPGITVYKNGELFINIKYQNDEAAAPGEEQYGVTVPYVVTEPLDYDASTDKTIALLQQIVNMAGSELVEYNIFDVVPLYDENGDPLLDEDGDPEYDYVMKPGIAEKYGLKNPANAVYYKYILNLGEAQPIEEVDLDEVDNFLLTDLTKPDSVKNITAHDCAVSYDKKEGALRVEITGDDPYLVLPMKSGSYFNGDKFSTVTALYKTDHAGGGEFSFTTKDEPGKESSLAYDINATGGEYAKFEFNMSASGGWTKEIRSFRVGLAKGSEKGRVFYFKNFGFEIDPVADVAVLLSEKQYGEDGSEFYYAVSLLYDTIAKIDASSVSFLDWQITDYLDKPIFSVNIDKVSRIQINAGEKKYDFELTGIGDNLAAVETANGRTTFKGDDKVAGTNRGIRNFRKFYWTILTINREDYTDDLKSEDEDLPLVLQMDVTFRDGSVRSYKFYSYSDRRCLMTVNDRGRIFVLRSMLRKLLSDADKLMTFQTVDPEADT